MSKRRLKKILARTGLLLLTLVMVAVSGGCAPTGAQPRGWSGMVLADGTLFLASMEGKLVVVDVASRSRLRTDIPLGVAQPGGGWGCGAPSTVVAVYGTPAVSGKTVYIGGYDGRIHAVSLGGDGTSSWVYPAPAERSLQPIVGGLVLSQGKLYFGDSDGRLYALDTVGRQLNWEFVTGDKIWSTPAIDGDTLYIGSFDKKLYAVDIGSGSKKWELATGGAIITPPLVAGDTVYVGSFDRQVYAVNKADGTLKWKSAVVADNWFWAHPVVVNNVVYAGNLDGQVYAFATEDGSLVTKFDLKSPIPSSPVAVGNSVIFISQEGKVYSINTANNELKVLADVEDTSAPLYASEGVVYIHTLHNEALYALNAQTSVKLWSLLLGSK